MKICGTVRRPFARCDHLGAARRDRRTTSISAKATPFCGQQPLGRVAVAAERRGVDLDPAAWRSSGDAPAIIGSASRPLALEGNARPATSTSTRAAPAARRQSAQADSVAPEVITSSTSSTGRPGERARRGAGCAAKAPAWFAAPRVAAAMALRRASRGARTSASGSDRQARARARAARASSCRLVVAPPEQPAPVQRHRHDHVAPSSSGAARARPSSAPSGPRQVEPVAVLERQHQPARPSPRRAAPRAPRSQARRMAQAVVAVDVGPAVAPEQRHAAGVAGQAPAMNCVSRQQAAQRPCGASVGSAQARQRGGKIRSISAAFSAPRAWRSRSASVAISAGDGAADARPRPTCSTPTCSRRRRARAARRRRGLPARGRRRRGRRKAERG